MTKKAIKVIQGHYDGAIRGTVDDLGKMNTSMMAIWKHQGKDHSDCGDWCPAHSGDLEKANKNCLPKFVLDAIKPVFEMLSADSLLAKCTYGGSQNSKESFHHLIWSGCSKQCLLAGRGWRQQCFMLLFCTMMEKWVGWRYSPIWVLRKVSFHAFDRMRVRSAEKQVTEAARASRRKRQLAQAAASTSDASYQAGAF